MPGWSYSFIWDNDAINLNRSVPLHSSVWFFLVFFFFFFAWHAPKISSMQIHRPHKERPWSCKSLCGSKGWCAPLPGTAQATQRCNKGWASDIALHGVWKLPFFCMCDPSMLRKAALKTKQKKTHSRFCQKKRVAGKSLHLPNHGRLHCCAALLFHVTSLTHPLLEWRSLPRSVI